MKYKYIIISLFYGALHITINTSYGASDGTNYSDKFSDYLVGGMVVAPYSYGMHKHNKSMLMASGISHLSTFGVTQLTKYVVHRTRPDQSNDNSFFSGHSSAAFTSAALMCRFKKKICVPSIALASSVGILRITAGKHFLSDVIVGAYMGYANGTMIPTLFFNF